MSLQTRLSSLIGGIGTDIKNLSDLVNTKVKFVNTQDYVILASDNKTLIRFNLGPTTLTIVKFPAGLPPGFSVQLVCMGSTGFLFQADVGSTINGSSTAAQYKLVTAMVMNSNTWVIT